MSVHFQPPQLPKGTGLRAFLLALGGTAVLLVLVMFFNVADLIEKRRDSEAWVANKEAQIVRLAEWRRALAPGGLLRLQDDLLDTYPRDLQALRHEYPEWFGVVLPSLEEFSVRYGRARDAYERALQRVRSLGTLSLGTLQPGELPEQQEALREWELAALVFRSRLLDLYVEINEDLAERGLSTAQQEDVRALLESRWEARRDRLLARTAASAEAATTAREALAVVAQAEGQWYFEERTGFPVFEEEAHEVSFHRRIQQLGEILGIAAESRPRLVPVD